MPTNLTRYPLTLGPVTFNQTDDDGVEWYGELQGWGATKPTLDIQQNPSGNGGWGGESYRSSRVLVINGSLVAPSPALCAQAVDYLLAACALAGVTLTVVEAHMTRHVFVRLQDEVLTPRETDLYTSFSIQVVAEDPRKFGDDLTVSTGLPITGGSGLVAPFTAPFSVDSTIISGQASLTNPGTEAGPVLMRINGPVTGPKVTHVASGRSLIFASSLALSAGEWLDVDMENETVLANGQSNRAGFITSAGWSGFDPGVNTWAFSADTYSAGASIDIIATPAWP